MAKILIIGGGDAGLSAGIYAQIAGHSATICERHSVAGGNLTGWTRRGYTIDNCIHWLTGTNASTDLYKTWCDLGALEKVKVYYGESLYTYEYNGKTLSLYTDIERVKSEMISVSKKDEKEILQFIKAVKAIMGFMGIGGKNKSSGLNLFQKIASLPELIKYNGISTGQLAERFYHPLIRGFLISLLGTDFSASALLCVFATVCGKNGGVPEGGSMAMAQRMVSKFTSLGGEILTGKQAIKINLKKGVAHSVDFADNTQLSADYVVITTDPQIAFNQLLSSKMPSCFSRLYNNKSMQRFSGYHCAFACDSQRVPFKGDYIFDISALYRTRLHTNYLILREFTHEKSFAPQNRTVIQSITFCNESDARQFIELKKDELSYYNLKRKIAADVQYLIGEKFPQLKGNLQFLDVWTPATYNRYTGAEVGSFMSFLLPPKAIPKTLPNKVPGARNVFLATQWQQAPGGLPIAAKVGQLAVQSILKSEAQKSKTFFFPRKQANKVGVQG